jgi:hypothetical protein
MKEYSCEKCGKIFKQKCHWVTHTTNKKYPCITKEELLKKHGVNGELGLGVNTIVMNENVQEELNYPIQKISCRFCFKSFTRQDNLKRHIRNEKCEILRLQKEQKKNIFINLIEEEKIITQTKKDLKDINNIGKEIIENNQIEFLMCQINLLNEKLEKQKIESDKKIKLLTNKQKKDTEEQIKIMTERYNELEKNNKELTKTNQKLQKKMCKIVTKNNINNSGNTTNNTVINNPVIKLVNFGQEDLDNISYKVFIDTIKSQGAGLYNKAIEGIYFNRDYPENQNIYISDINRSKVMIYRDEKWLLENWDTVYPELLNKVIQFGYDKNEFLKDCGYKVGDTRYNQQMIKNGMKWYKLLDDATPDVDYFELEENDRPKIDEQTYNEYLEMYKFRQRHPKNERESNIKNKMKLNMYNKREIPINNYKKIENESKKLLLEKSDK